MNEHTRAFLEPRRDQIEMFFNALFRHAGARGYVSLRAFYEDETKPFRISAVPLTGGLPFVIERAFDDAHRAANDPRRVVFCPPIAIFENGERAREKDILAGLALSVELDQHPQQARDRLVELLGEPTLVVRSGGLWIDPASGEVMDKLHIHWRLAQPATRAALDDLKLARDLATRLVGGDPSNKPVCHPIRMAGSWHRKAEPRLCEIIEQDPDREIELADALAALRAVVPEEQPKTNSATGSTNGTGEGGHDWRELIAGILSGQTYHPFITPMAAKLVHSGMSDGANVNLLRAIMENGTATRDARWKARYDDIPRAVSSASVKYRTAAAAADPNQFWNPWKKPFVPVFPLETLPVTQRDYIQERAETTGCDPAALAMGSFVGMSAMLDLRIVLRPKKYDDSWEIYPNLWVIVAGDPADKKSPAINQVMRFPLAADKRDAETYAREVERIKAQAKETGEDPKDLIKDIKPARRRIIRDTTTEALCGLLSEQHCGTTLVSHELSGFIGQMDKYNNSRGGSDANRAMWNMAYDGGPYGQDRASGGRFAPHMCVSVIAAVQPAKLREMGSLDSDGFLQRFNSVVMQHAVYDQDLPKDPAIYRNVALLHERLGAIDRRRVFAFDDDAIKVFQAFSNDATDMLRANNSFGSFCGKQTKTLGTIALILHACELVEGRVGATDYVSQETVERAEQIVRGFVIPHGAAFYSLADGRASQENQMIAGTILNFPGNTIKLRDLTQKNRAIKGTKDHSEKQRKLYPFIAGGWLIPVAPGVDNTTWDIAPGLRQRFTAEREAHNTWVAEIQATIKRTAHTQRTQDPDDPGA